MRIAICYTDFEKGRGRGTPRPYTGKPLLSQNRQFQWYSGLFPYAVYPVVMASAATILKQMGHEVIWQDYIAEGKSYEEFVKDFLKIKPGLAVFESKTPVIKYTWEIINFLKKKLPKTKFVLCGDHVSARPEESLRNCNVDFVLGGGDYDELLMNLVSGGFLGGEFGPKNEHQKKGNQGQTKADLKISEKFSQINHSFSKMSSILTDESTQTIASNKFPVNTHGSFIAGRVTNNPTAKSVSIEDKTFNCEERSFIDKDIKFILVDAKNFVNLPLIDRELTKWKLYAYNNGNFKYTPGAYTMAGRDCWWRRGGGCTFCSWTGLYPKWKVVKPERLLDEIGYLIDLGVKEVFDDTGTFPVGVWLKDFCEGMVKRGFNKKIKFGCNMRAGVLDIKDYRLMKKSGFRLILFGVESANNRTLEKINKGVTIEQIERDLKMAKRAGLSPHATVMFGYPWESYDDAKKTVELAKKLFKNNIIDSLQATIVIPYPGTKLFEDCKKKKLLRTMDWDKYDMRMPIMKCPISDEQLKGLVRECYSTVLTLGFLIRQIGQIRTIGDIKYLAFSGVKFFSKLGDFK